MPIGITEKVRERKKAVLELLAGGCKSTTDIMNALNLTHTKAFYTLKTLKNEGYIKGLIVGKTAIWCLTEAQLNQVVNTMLKEIRRLVERHCLKYVYPSRLYKLIIEDQEASKIFAQYIPIYSNSGSVRAFLNYLLGQLYPLHHKGEKMVYMVPCRKSPKTRA
jgi:predicted transcriptional regulator